ncbi:MAG: 16S rRNA processing protein RimM [Proteobacteria bacterium]|nr:MAG: 16S rRNA processing protein RimM [Pseudomonadota bacterium]PIE17911.1 MAG: 16S rRNA processing protein RimM [Pseudomonadota bacterium]
MASKQAAPTSDLVGADLLEIGAVTRPHGVRGALKVRLHDPSSSALESVPRDRWRLREASGLLHDGLRVESEQGEILVVRLPRVADRDAAERLRGAALCVPRELIHVDEDEFLVADLLGCQVVEGARSFGEIVDVFNAGASDVMVVRDNDDRERLIPLVDDWVTEVDLEARRVELLDGDAWDLDDD